MKLIFRPGGSAFALLICMRKLALIAILALTIMPLRFAQSSRTVSYDDLVGTYKPAAGSSGASSNIPWFQIEKTEDGKDVNVFLLAEDLKNKTKIFTSASGHFNGPAWLTPHSLLSLSQSDLASLPTGETASQAVTTPTGFVLVQTNAYKGQEGSFAGSDTIGFSQASRPTGSVLKVQWNSVRFSKESLAKGKVLKSFETLYLSKMSAI